MRPGCCIRGNEASAEEVVPFAIATILIDRRRTKGHVDNAALDVDRNEPPDVDARSILPAFARPRVVVLLARAGNRVKGPHQFSGVNVPRAHVAGWTPRAGAL